MSRMFERACGELNIAHYRVLAAVAEGERRASQVAQRLALGKPTVRASVDALCRRGLLTREPSTDDQRVAVLKLTPAGDEVLAQTETAMVERFENVLRKVDDRRSVLAALEQLAAALDDVAAERLAAKAAR
jgi:DNA-binding MarR family transcriptional regulator